MIKNILTVFSLLAVSSVTAGSYSGPLIHPNADGACEWNRNAKWFMYAPSFGFTNVPGVAKYHFKVRGGNGADFDLESAKPVVSLVDCWDRIPVGYVSVSCESGERKFWKAAPFREGAYPAKARSYREAAKGVYDYIFNMKETKYLVQNGKPDASYELNTYVSKMFAVLIKGMIRYAELEPSRRAEALDVAKKAADHLIRKSEPADAPLAYFPPTYDGRGEKDNGYVAEKFQGQIMLIYPAHVASAFVKLSKVLGDKRYLEVAEKIASNYLKLQGEDGTWYLKMYAKDGKPVTPNRLIPIDNAITMFEELYAETGKAEYRAAADRAFKSVEGRLDDWNWEGQFEDVNPTKKYENLTKHPACSTAIYLGERYPGDAKRRAQMREIMRFAEDQFVCWENPFRGHHVSVWGGTYDDWICPAALEQYNCYYPIDASAAKIIRAYLALYRSEGDRTYLAKAKALGDTATRVQCPDGRLPTWWWPQRAKLVYADWINCMIASAIALEELADADGFAMKAGEVKTVDFGPDGVGGYPCVDFAAARGARVRLSYATHPDGLGEKGDFHHETKANYMGDALWLPILPASTDRFDIFDAEGNGSWRAPLAQGLVRYVRVAVESGSAEFSGLRFVNDGIHSEEPVVGSFECSDPRVNDAWKASVRTCQLAAIPARTKPLAVRGVHTNAVLGTTYAYLSDGAKRDRLVWSGDLWWAQRNMYAAFAHDSPYMPGSIRMLAENHTPDGYVQACPFPESHGPLKEGEYGPFASDEFAAWFIPVVWDHVLHTGDRKLAREVYPQVRGLVAYLVRHTGPDGVFEQRRETCKHSCGLAVGGTSMHHRSYMNVLNAIAYRDAAKLAAWLGEETDGKEWAKLAERTAAVTRKAFWDETRGYFRLSLEEPVFAFEVNALALASGFATASEASRVLPQFKRNGHGKFQLLAVRGAFACGFPEKAMELVEAHNWFRYFDPEWKGLRTVYECCGMWTKGWSDEAHPDACIAGVFSNYLLGVEPVEPGYRVFRVRPLPTKTVTSATGSVPTPFGPIRVSWWLENGKVVTEVSAPKGLEELH